MTVTVWRQADPRWSGRPLGRGSSTIGRGGCLLVCFAMAAERILGNALTPPEAQERCLEAGAFRSSLLLAEDAARALGLVLVDRVGGPGQLAAPPASSRALVDEALEAGGCAIVHVDHNARGGGDHFVLVYDRAGRGYLAADPAPGTSIVLDAELRGRSLWGTTSKAYRAVGAMFVGKNER